MVRGRLGLSYHVYPEGNVSRQGLYGSYLKSCTMHGVKAIKCACSIFVFATLSLYQFLTSPHSQLC